MTARNSQKKSDGGHGRESRESQLSVRIPFGLRAELAAFAERDDRTLSQAARLLIKRGLEGENMSAKAADKSQAAA